MAILRGKAATARQADAIDKAVRAQGGGVVKPNQVKAMILAARRAFKVQSELGLVDDGVGFDAWRRATLHDVTGGDAPESFRTVTQRDYAAVMDYFGELAGDRPGKPGHQDSARRADDRERALWALNLMEEEVAEAFTPGHIEYYYYPLFLYLCIDYLNFEYSRVLYNLMEIHDDF